MKGITSDSAMLMSRLPQISSMAELLELSCALLRASVYVIDGSGRIIEHSDSGAVKCRSWLNAVEQGRLSEAHKKTVLTPEINCNVIRDEQCAEKPCARLSVPIKPGDWLLPGAVLFFLWDNDPTLEKQTYAAILAGAVSNLLQQGEGSDRDLRAASIAVLKDLLNYKPGLKLYFTNAIKSSEFSGFRGGYRLCVLSGQGVTAAEAEKLGDLCAEFRAFEHMGNMLVLWNNEKLSDAAARDILEPFALQNGLKVCCSVGFDELIKLRYIYEDTVSAFEIASAQEPERSWYSSESFLSRVLLRRLRAKLSPDELYPDFFLRLIDYDRKTGKDYLRTLSAYLDSGRNTNAAAKQCFMHRNTMVQQLERMEQLMGVSLDDSEMCFLLQLCIRMHNADKLKVEN